MVGEMPFRRAGPGKDEAGVDARKKLGAGGCTDVADGDGLEEETTVVELF